MMSRSKQQGFSLVELIVVFTIVAVLMGLTGGLLTRNIEQQERVVEVESINQLFKKLMYKSIFTGEQYRVDLSNNTLQYSNTVDNYIEKVDFKHLSFKEQSITINAMGYVEPGHYVVNWNDSQRKIDLEQIFDEH